jgi:MFS family permease
MAVSRRASRFGVVNFCFILSMAVGALAFFCGESSPWLFAAAMFGLSFCASMSRPAGAYITLNYHDRDSGAASSLLGAAGSFTGSLGAAVVTVHPRYVLVIGLITVIVSAVCIVLWIAISRGYDVNKAATTRN